MARTNTARPWQGRSWTALWRLLSVTLPAAGLASAQSAPFVQDHERLTVRTPALELTVQGAAIVSIRDVQTGESFADCDAWDKLPKLPGGSTSVSDAYWFGRYWSSGEHDKYAADERFRQARRRVTPESSCQVRQLDARSARITCRRLSGAGAADDALSLGLELTPGSGDVVLELTASVQSDDHVPVSCDLPLLGLHPRSVILGSGARYVPGDPPLVDCTTRVSNGLYSPDLVVIEGERSVVACWAEAAHYEATTVYVAHAPGEDTVILDTSVLRGGRPAGVDARVLRSARWRIGVFSTWLEAARRYRESLEQRRGAQPLWDKHCRWARSTHAVCTHVPNPDSAVSFYDALAAALDPGNILLFYWNGSRVILHGDHRYMAKSARPNSAVVDALVARGFRWMGYHGYTLLQPPHEAARRLQDLAAKGELPDGFEFTPDYDGKPEDFCEHFRPVSTGYYQPMDEARLWVIHAGTRTCRDYLLRNLANYCRTHRMSGAYLDILGSAADYQFPPEKKLLEGHTWRTGEEHLLQALRRQLPDIALMSEYQNERTIPYTVYSWTGTGHVVRQAEVGTRLNHPLRTALWGSYTWTRENELDPADAALVGTLPDVSLEDEWSIARARLFAKEGLFNDLPPLWHAGALACYRSASGAWFEFRELPFGDGFIEVKGEGHRLHLGRFIGVQRSALDCPARIPGWPAYESGNPIGLNAARAYPFLLETPADAAPVRITSLPAGVYVRGVRHRETFSVVEFGHSGTAPITGRVQMVLAQPCLRLIDADRDYSGSFAAHEGLTVETRFPGGLVFIWQEPTAVDARFRGCLLASTAHHLAHGVTDSRWCFNQRIHCSAATVAGRTVPTIQIGYGRHRGISEGWVSLAADLKPALKLLIAYAPVVADARQRRLTRALRCGLSLNGTELWHTRVAVGTEWSAHHLPLAAYAGRTVLLTLSAEAESGRNVPATHTDFPALFGNVHVDGNPHPMPLPESAAPPWPSHVILRDCLDAPELDTSWTRHLSSAHRGQPHIGVAEGKLGFTGEHYRHLYLSRVFPHEATCAQARLQVGPTGCQTGWNPGIGLYWNGGRFCFVTAGGYGSKGESFVVRGVGARIIAFEAGEVRVDDSNRYDLWLRIGLTAEHIVYSCSVDGATWLEKARVPRPADCAGPPDVLILGRGGVGEEEWFSNDERWSSNTRTVYMDDLVIGTQ